MEIFNQIKKAVASFTLGALLFGFVTPVANAQLGFTDDAEIPSWSFDAIDELMAQGVISGNDDGSFAPNRQLNRAEVSKIIVLASGVDLDTTGGPHFPDVQPGAWYYDYVETMYNNGWINGYPDGYFRPEVGINRAEIAKMVVNAFEIDPDTAGAPHFDDVTSGDWFHNYVETAYNYGLMRGYGDGNFGPADPVTRAQTVKIVYDAQLVVTGPTGPAAGTLEVTLSYDTPRGTNIPFNATSVPFTTVELTASDDSDVEISSLTFTRLGLGDNDDFDNVWLEIDGFKVGNDKSVNNDDIVELRFNPPVVIPAGQTVVGDLVTSLKYRLNADGTCFGNGSEGCNIGHHNRFAVVSADDVASTAANVVGDFPVEGEEMEIADYQVSELQFTTLGSDTTVDVGDNFIEIGKYRMLNLSKSNKDVELRAVTFKNDGVAELEDVLENVALYVSGEQISAETIIDGDYVTFRLDNGVTGGYILEDGDSRIFSVRADIVSAEKGDTIKFKVDNFEDIVGVEIGTSFGVKAVTGESTTECESGVSDAEDNCATLRTYAIDAGDLNVSRDPSSLGNQQYAPGSNDVVFLTARLTVDQPLIVDGLKIHAQNASVADTSADDNTTNSDLADLNVAFDNFRVYLNDKLIDSENDFSGTTADAYLDFNTTFEIAGTSVLKVVGNVQDAATTGDKVQLFIAGTDFASPEYISTGDQVESDELLGSAQASFVEVEKSTLVISKSDGLSSGDDIVAGVDDVTLLEFILDNNDSGDVNVTSVTIQGVGAGTPVSNYSNFTAAIFVDGTQQGSSKNLDSSTGLATFNDLSVIISSAAQKEFTVVVDTIETIAGANKANTTVTGGSTTIAGTNFGLAHPAGDCVTGTVIPAGAMSFCVAGDQTAALTSGVEVAVSSDGTAAGTNAERKFVSSSTYDAVTSTTTVVVQTAFENEHGTATVGATAQIETLSGLVGNGAQAQVDTISAIDGNGPTSQVDTVTGVAGDGTDTFSVTVDGVTETVTFDTDIPTTMANLATVLNANGTINTKLVASVSGSDLVLTAVDAITAFTASFAVVDDAAGVAAAGTLATVAALVGDAFNVTVNGAALAAGNVAYDTDGATTAAAIAAAINADPTAAAVVTASVLGADVKLTADTAGTAFTLTTVVVVADAGGVAPAAIAATTTANGTGDTFAVTVDGVAIAASPITFDTDAATTAAAIAAAINADPAASLSVTAAVSGSSVVVTDKTTGVPAVNPMLVVTPADDGGAPTAAGTVVVTTAGTAGTGTALAQQAGTVVTQYAAGTTVFTVASTSNITVNDVLDIQTSIGTETCTVTAVDVTTGTVTVDCDATTTGNQGTVGTFDSSSTVVESSSSDQIAINVTAVDADNVENGQSVTVSENGLDLGAITAYDESTSNDGDCNVVTGSVAVNYLCGSVFDVIRSGQLSVENVNVNPESQILVAGASDIEVLRVKLIASDDDIEVKDLHFIQNAVFGNTIQERVDFKLKDASGNLIQEKTMINGKLHFELANQDRIRVPKDSSTNVSVYVDVRQITEQNQTARQLQLAVDPTQGVNGFEADTVATGSDLDATALNSGAAAPEGEEYIAYRTKLTFANATKQPTLSSKGAITGSGVANPIFRFNVTADSAYGATLNKLTFDVSSSAGVLGGSTALTNSSSLKLFRYSSSAYTGTPTQVALTAAGTAPNATLSFTDSEDVEAGATVYYELHTTEAIVDVATNDTDKINVRFEQDTLVSGTNVEWTDRANAGAENTVQLSGYELTYPSDSDGAQQ